LEAGDGIRLGGEDQIWRVTEVMQASAQALELRVDPEELSRVRSLEPVADIGGAPTLAVPEIWVIDAPVLPDAGEDWWPLIAGVGTAWPSPVTVSAGLDATQVTARAELSERAGVGRLLSPLATGPLGRWDEAAVLHIDVPGEILASHSKGAALAGAGPILVCNATGWELIGYRTARLTGAGQYELTGLLRGLQGSQILSVESGAFCVLLDNRLQRGNVGAEERGIELIWQAQGRGLFGPLLADTFEDKAELEFAPVHLRIKTGETGRRVANWVRRGAEIRDNWTDVAAVNIGRFAVDLLRNGVNVKSAIVDQAVWDLPDNVLEGDVLTVRQIGPDGRPGWPAQLIL